MAVSISSSQQSMLEQMTSLVFRGFPDSALSVLENSDFTEKQREKIKTILTQPHGGYTLQATEAMKQSIIVVIKGEDVQPAASNDVVMREEDVQPAASTDVVMRVEHDQPLELYPDIVGVIFRTCISVCDVRTIRALPCVNKYWNQLTINFFAGCDLPYICPELTIMDAKTQQRECVDEPKIDKFTIFKAVKKVAPHVEGNAGVTLLTMIKGDNFKKLFEIANQEGIQVVQPFGDILTELVDFSVEQTYTILITNSVFMDSRSKDYKPQNTLVEGHGCQMPTGQEYAALCIFAEKTSQKCLYGQNPKTYGRSSTRVKGIPMLVGNSAPGTLCVFSGMRMVNKDSGAGGSWKF